MATAEIDFRDAGVFMGLYAYAYDDETMALVGRAWAERRDAFLAEWLSHDAYLGRRPWAFWEYDLEEEMPDIARLDERAHTARLVELGLVGADERRRLLAAAREPTAPSYIVARARALRAA
jgi:hypothetical protein